MTSKQNNGNVSASKKIRMTMACERCRSKKVKCDFTHPQCSRCQQSKVQCSYDGSSTQIDLFSLVKLNETVDLLQKKVQSIESDIKDVCSNTQFVANKVRMNQEELSQPSLKRKQKEEDEEEEQRTSIKRKSTDSNTQWSLSLTPKGLRIDTNIASLHDLYDILLSGVSQFDLSNGNCMHQHDSSVDGLSQSSSLDSPKLENTTIVRKKPLWKSRLKTLPLYSSWEPNVKKENKEGQHKNGSFTGFKTELMSDETFFQMISSFEECFLCLPCCNPSMSLAERYKKGILDPLLANSVLAWTSRHTAIYHNLYPGRDPNQVGQVFFLKAKELVKERFMTTSIDTMFSLLIMYIYAIGIPGDNKSEVESEAYIYLGLAIRMCLDLKMNQESTSSDPYEQELHRRFFWVLYFLETLSSVHSDRAFTLPPKNMITVQFPTLMEHERSGETRYRVEFIIHRFKITRIYRNIICKTTEEKPLFSQISAIDKELKLWYSELPSYFKYEPGDIYKKRWDSDSFREQACVKLNFEYNFQLCQLYGIFFSSSSKSTATTTTSTDTTTIELLARETCLKAAQTTIELLECWVQLRQLWCHFSLENLMATTIIYSYVITEPTKEREIAKKNLEKMAQILMSSPVRHHKYVLTLVSKIRAILQDAASGGNIEFDTEEEEEEVIIPHPTATTQPQQEPSIQPVSLTNQFNRKQQPANPYMLDVASASSPFDIIKTNTFSEDMHFSDFVYNPTLLLNDPSLLGTPSYNMYVPHAPMMPPSSAEEHPWVASTSAATTSTTILHDEQQRPFMATTTPYHQEGYRTSSSSPNQQQSQFYNPHHPYSRNNNNNNNNNYY